MSKKQIEELKAKDAEDEKASPEKPAEGPSEKRKKSEKAAGKSSEKTKEPEKAEEPSEKIKESEEDGKENKAGAGVPEKEERKSGGKVKWIILAAAAVVLAALAVVYIRVAEYYKTHFFPGSSVNGIACGNMTAAELAVLVDAQSGTYVLQVFGRDYATGEPSALLGEVLPEDISLSYEDSLGGVEQLLARQEEWSWILAYIGRDASEYAYSLMQGFRFDGDKLKEVVTGWAACSEKNMLPPRDAYISEYTEEAGGYQVIPETVSTTLAMDKVLGCIADAIYEKQALVDLDQELCYIDPKVTQTDEKLTAAVETANTWLGTEITYDWNGSRVVLDAELLKEWITMEEDGPTLDEEAVSSFVKEQARKYNTYGRKKNFVTTLGIELTLDSPNYGWRTDTETETRELLELIRLGSVTEREPVYSARGLKKGAKDIGGDYVEADLTHQHLWLYHDGQLVHETDFVSGKMNVEPSLATPAGIFGVTYKTTNAILRGPGYETPVSYWMPFYGDFGMHDAGWRKDFGGTIYQDFGSHGCINLPPASAAVIYEYVSKGFPVICYYYEVDPLAPQENVQMPSAEELLSQQEPAIGQETAPNQ